MKLTSEKRKKLPSSKFAEPGKRKYPLDTRNRARNALSRVSQHGSEAEKKTIRKKVHALYPSIGENHFKAKKPRKSINGRKRARVKA